MMSTRVFDWENVFLTSGRKVAPTRVVHKVHCEEVKLGESSSEFKNGPILSRKQTRNRIGPFFFNSGEDSPRFTLHVTHSSSVNIF
jgi:hypothetical protein